MLNKNNKKYKLDKIKKEKSEETEVENRENSKNKFKDNINDQQTIDQCNKISLNPVQLILYDFATKSHIKKSVQIMKQIMR